nr:SGNH/GDSL hydrolase family protein [uncultured Duganella sp.]
MTVKLLKPYGWRPAGAIISTLDASTEAALIAAGKATADLTGGTRYFQKKPGVAVQPKVVAVGAISLQMEEQATCELPEGQVLKIIGGAGAVGEATRAGSVDKWTIGAGALPPIGPFSGTQKILITCAAGSIDAVVGDAVLGTAQALASAPLVFFDALGTPTPIVRAVRPILYPMTRKALAGVRNKRGAGGIHAMVGDSTERGRGALNAGNYVGARPYSRPSQLAQFLTAMGINAKDNSFFGNGVFPATQADYNNYDTRFSGSGFTPSGANCMGGTAWQANSAAIMTCSPTDALTTYDIFYIDVNACATWSWDFGGAATNVVGTGTSSGIGGKMKKVTVSVPAGPATTPLNIKWVSGTVYVFGLLGRNLNTPEWSVVNLGGDGWAATNWAGSTFPDYSTTLSIKLLAPVLTTFRMGINDWQANKDVATFQAKMQIGIDAAKVSGEVILEASPYAKLTGGATQASMDAFITAMRELAFENNCDFYDHSKRWGGQAAYAAMGWYDPDDTHIKADGLTDLAVALGTPLLTL